MKRIITFLFVFLITTSVFSQSIVEKSTDVIFILGRKYYVHTVKSGETLYSIGKVYGVPLDQILLINKETVEQLESGKVLRIPLIDENYVPEPINKVTFKEHTVQKNESLYAIAFEYGTTQDLIIKYNPQISNGIEKGMVLKIPIEEKTDIKSKDEYFVYHQVKNGDNLQLIAQQYGVSVEDILQFNQVKNPLETGTILSVPNKPLTEEQRFLLMYNKNFKADFLNVDPNYFEDPSCLPCSQFKYSDTMTFDIGFVLPLYLNENYSLSIDAYSSPSNARFYEQSMVFYDYLQGALLAIDDLRKEGMNFNIHIQDTRGDSATLEGVLNKYEMTKLDLIIGPAYSKNFDIVKQFASKYKINFVSPFASRPEVVKNNPFVFQVIPGNNEIVKNYALYWAQYADTSNYAVISDGSSEQLGYADSIHKYLTLFTESPDSIYFKKITYSKFVDVYRKNLDKFKTNYVFVPTTDEIQASAILNNLNSLVNVEKYKIVVYMLPIVESFTKLQSDWISNLNIHFASFAAPQNKEDKDNFEAKYKMFFGRKPGKYSMYGYDITYYFATALRQYGKYFQFCLGKDQEFMNGGMFMKFYFKRYESTSGFENKSMYIIRYKNDLSTEIIEEPKVKPRNYID